MGDLNHVLEESIGCHRVVKVFGGQEYEGRRFAQAADKVRRFQMKIATAAAATVPTTHLVASFAVAAIVYFVIGQAARDQTTVGGFVSYLAALFMLMPPIKRLTNVNETMQRGLAAAETVFGLIDEQPEADRGTIEIGRARGEIEFQRVSFTYPDAAAARARGGHAPHRAGRDGRARRRLGQRQDDASPTCCRVSTSRADGRILVDGVDIARAAAREPALEHRARQPGHRALQRQRRGEHRLRPPRRSLGGRHRRRRGRRARARVHPRDAAGARDAHRRGRRAALGRTAPAPGDRARLPQGRADPDPRRGDERARQRVGAQRSGGARSD